MSPDDNPTAPPSPDGRRFRLGFVPGVTPAKWVSVWRERLPDVPMDLVPLPVLEADAAVREGTVDAALLRLPVDREALSAIPLYEETPVVVVPKDHVVSAFDAVPVDDLDDEVFLHPLDDRLGWAQLPGRPAAERPATTADAVELVAAGVGLLVVPQSLARLHHRKDLVFREATGAPTSTVALAWVEDRTTDLVEEMIGIVRGRTPNSSRGRGTQQDADAPTRAAPSKGAQAGRAKPQKAGARSAAARAATDRQQAAARKAAAKNKPRGGKRGKR
ncbi:LysR substrate-binding domain-containing protein [Sanguibacter suaedae]|uniref:LysR family transcriptional regulator n=1 Tax=Sanguibacter suaedae TaxID=2795737 RepID=A0A934I7R4_9MICO|nr:LysR substrate-binding domain-containing protein [Sanguibacter suaedae]MBI9114707.1 LysR family transcriptional regulator [Sanguibacter suaedae]